MKAFSPPSLVCDPTLPATLPERVREGVEDGEKGGSGGRGEGKMRGVNREGVRETGGAQFAITGATGQKVSKKEDECVCERATE